ncbi:MAG: tetratricopeptide repeat protein [Cytophagales bacterium]|nr:tetratricopeptide repeat protein [Bernardetiaceae bacterium]MDW8204156.1 tetratricopeptide repeat protein [Cytophagales bacterium]
MKRALFFICFVACIWKVHISSAQKGSGIEYYVNAQNLHKAKRYDAALQQYNKAIQAEPQVPDYWYGMAECWWDMKNPAKALETLAKCTEVKKEYAKAYELAAKIYETAKAFDKAGAQHEQAFEYQKDPVKKIAAAVASATAYIKVRSYDRALAIIEKGKSLQANNPDLNYLEAKIYNQQKQYQKTIGALNTFIPKLPSSIAPKDLARYYFELGYAYYCLEDYSKANEFLQKADIGIFKPRVYELSAEYFFKTADAYAKVYEYEKAREFASQAIKIRPNYKEANELLRDINESSEEIMKRIRAQMDSINKEKNPEKRSKMHCELCRNQFKAGEYAAAIVSAEECLRTNQKNIVFVFYKSIAQYKSGNHTMAIFEMDKISKVPTLPPETKAMMLFALGLMYKEDKQPQMAASYFKRMNGTPFAEAARIELKALRKVESASADEEEDS